MRPIAVEHDGADKLFKASLSEPPAHRFHVYSPSRAHPSGIQPPIGGITRSGTYRTGCGLRERWSGSVRSGAAVARCRPAARALPVVRRRRDGTVAWRRRVTDILSRRLPIGLRLPIAVAVCARILPVGRRRGLPIGFRRLPCVAIRSRVGVLAPSRLLIRRRLHIRLRLPRVLGRLVLRIRILLIGPALLAIAARIIGGIGSSGRLPGRRRWLPNVRRGRIICRLRQNVRPRTAGVPRLGQLIRRVVLVVVGQSLANPPLAPQPRQRPPARRRAAPRTAWPRHVLQRLRHEVAKDRRGDMAADLAVASVRGSSNPT